MTGQFEGPRIAVVGAGSIGGVTAALLARAGSAVEVVCHHEWRAEKIRTTGIQIRGRLGSLTAVVPAVAGVEALSGEKEVVFLATKAQDMIEPARQLLPHLSERSLVVSLQNGIALDALSEILGRERVVGCVVGWGSTLREDGSIDVTSRGSYVVGMADGSRDARLDQVAALLSLIVPTRITTNIYGALFSKLMINTCINSVGAITGLPMAPMLAAPPVLRLFQRILAEAEAVARASGITIEPYGRQFNLYRIISASGPAATLIRGLFSRLVGFLGYGEVRSSTLQSLERGRPTEIDWLNGQLVKLGREHGVATPVNEQIVRMVKEIEQGARPMGIANLSEIT